MHRTTQALLSGAFAIAISVGFQGQAEAQEPFEALCGNDIDENVKLSGGDEDFSGGDCVITVLDGVTFTLHSFIVTNTGGSIKIEADGETEGEGTARVTIRGGSIVTAAGSIEILFEDGNVKIEDSVLSLLSPAILAVKTKGGTLKFMDNTILCTGIDVCNVDVSTVSVTRDMSGLCNM